MRTISSDIRENKNKLISSGFRLKGDQFLAAGSPIPGLRVLANGTLWIHSMDHHLAGIYSCIAVAPEDTVTAKAYILVRNAPNDASCGIGEIEFLFHLLL